MASEGTDGDHNVAVADIASRLFGVAVNPAEIITETLESVTDDDTLTDKRIVYLHAGRQTA